MPKDGVPPPPPPWARGQSSASQKYANRQQRLRHQGPPSREPVLRAQRSDDEQAEIFRDKVQGALTTRLRPPGEGFQDPN